MAFSDNVWWTRKSRIQAEKRFKQEMRESFNQYLCQLVSQLVKSVEKMQDLLTGKVGVN